MTGPEMMINSLIKLFKLEPYVEIIRQQVKDAAEEGWVEKAKNGVNQIATFDERLARIERRLGICDNEFEPGSGSEDSDGGNVDLGSARLEPPQRTDN